MSFLRDKLIDFFIYLMQVVPYPVTHNIEKTNAIRKAFWHLNLEKLSGDYFEFGVAFGNSLRSAQLASKKSIAPRLGVNSQPREFFAFDTFEAFTSSDKDDNHATWTGEKFSFPFETVKARFRKNPEVKLFKGDVSDLGHDSLFFKKVMGEIGSNRKVAIAMFDMDLKGPTASALRFLEPMLQNGSILIFDEFYAFGGAEELGESGALREFLVSNQNVSLREFASYGDGGRIFQVQLRESPR